MELNMERIPLAIRMSFGYIVNIFSGFLIVTSIYHSFYIDIHSSYGESLFNISNYITENIFLLILFLIILFTIGSLSEQLSDKIPIKVKLDRSDSIKNLFELGGISPGKSIEIDDLINKEENSYIVSHLQKLSIDIHMIKSIGVATFISFIILSIGVVSNLIIMSKFKLFDLLLLLFFLALSIISAHSMRNKDNGFIEYYKAIGKFLKKKEEEKT